MRLKPSLHIAWIALLLVFFQNCTEQKMSGHSAQSSQSQQAAGLSGGNGTGYDGKPYTIGHCRKYGEPRRRMILNYSQRKALLVRENCADLPPPFKESALSNSSFDPSVPATLTVDGQVHGAEELHRDYLAVCKGPDDNGDPLTVQLWNSGGAYFGELVRVPRSSGAVLSTGEHRISYNSDSDKIDFKSSDQIGDNEVLEGDIELSTLVGSVAFVLSGQAWEVENGLSCAVN